MFVLASTFGVSLKVRIKYLILGRVSNQQGLEAAVEATATFLNNAVKPVIVGGPKLRVAKAQKAFLEFAEACGYPIAVLLAPSSMTIAPLDTHC